MIKSSFEIPVMKTKLNSRVAYTEANVIGKGIYGYTDPKAEKEIIALTKEVLSKAKQHKLVGYE